MNKINDKKLPISTSLHIQLTSANC